jgi:hypothetical protein
MGKPGSLLDERVHELHGERARVVRRTAVGLLPLALAVAGCTSGGGEAPPGGDAAAPPVESTAPPIQSCAEARHVVVFDFFGFVSQSDEDLPQWLADPADTPDVRPGAPETVNAYRSLGYEIAYLTTVPVNMTVGEQPIDDAIRGWLAGNGFPGGEGTSIMTWDSGDPIIGITDQLLRFAGQGVSVDAGYTDNEDKAYAIITGGVSPTTMYTVGSAAGTQGSRAIPNDDVLAHALNVQRLPRICEPAAPPGATTTTTTTAPAQ